MRVRAELSIGEWTVYKIIDDETGETIGQAENELNLKMQCQAHNWSLINPPKRRRQRRGAAAKDE